MKHIFYTALLGAFTFTAGAQITEFELGPAIDGAGLLGQNERPTPVSTTATGGELEKRFALEPSITYNDATDEIFINIAWGDAHDFTDLEGAYTASHIHGPASTESAATVLYPLTANQQTVTDGFVNQTIALTPLSGYTIEQQRNDLFNGLWYINVHTDMHESGEIRGQLTPIPEPETYAMIAGLGLVGFAFYRRYRTQTA